MVHSESSFAESFTTATEGFGNSHNASRRTSQAQLGAQNERAEERQEDTVDAQPMPLNGLSAYHEDWKKQLIDDSDRSEARVRVKNYHIDSDSELEKSAPRSAHGEKVSSSEDGEPPSTNRTALNHRAAFQRLRRPLQPGDDFKRPDEALLYGNNLSWRPKKKHDLIKAPKREMSAEFMRNAGLEKINLDTEPASTSQHSINVQTAVSAMPVTTSPDGPRIEPELTQEQEHPFESELEPARPLREFAPSSAPADEISPPTTATKQSLEDNNQVYKLIQAENVKRHSTISDGTVQAVVVHNPELRRQLRHTRKRESLRGDISPANVDQRGSENGDVKSLRRKRGVASLSPMATNRRVVSDQHETYQSSSALQMATLRSHSAAPDSGPTVRSGPVRLNRAPAIVEGGRLARQRSQQHSPREHFKASTPTAVANESRRMTSAPTPQPRPWSMDLSTTPQTAASPRLRRFSREERLDKNPSVRRTSLDTTTVRPTGLGTIAMAQDHFTVGNYATLEEARRDRAEQRRSRTIREFNDATPLVPSVSGPEQSPVLEHRTTKAREASLELPMSPKRRSLDPRYLHSNGTPFSTSQLSDRTALTEPELCEARGVELYPHNNRSLLLVQHSAQPSSPRSRDHAVAGAHEPVFEAVVEGPDGQVEDIGRAKHTVDSPLTNPRAAPEPPIIKFIPPTPNEEIERMLGDNEASENGPRDFMQRRPSLKQRMRRFSEGLIEPLPFGRNGSMRRTKHQAASRDERPTHLSSNWVPNDIWADEDDYSDEEDFEPLPPGGDTSDVGDTAKVTFPRKMSKRMPGFRGKGGFLQGNSLGIDRHGTNNRRHYVNTRNSQDMLNRMTSKQPRRGALSLPFGRGTKIEYIGFAGLGAKMREVRRRREEKALEKRRDQLRRQIGVRMFHEGRP